MLQQKPSIVSKCDQTFVFQPNDFGLFGATTGTEDCLVLNIYVPRQKDEDSKDKKLEGLPVLVGS